MRLFIALDIPDVIRDRISAYVADLKKLVPDARFVRVEGLHVTLKFLGETEKLPQLRDALATIDHPRFAVDFAETGFFPDARRPRIFWVGVHSSSALPQLAAKIDDVCHKFGFACEERPFKPHLTLARSGSGSPHHAKEGTGDAPLGRLAKLIATAPKPQFGKMDATGFHIFESQLHPAGAVYTKVATYPLLETE